MNEEEYKEFNPTFENAKLSVCCNAAITAPTDGYPKYCAKCLSTNPPVKKREPPVSAPSPESDRQDVYG